MGLQYIFLLFCYITLSQQQVVKITENLIPSEFAEGQPATLRCVITDSAFTSVEWLKDEEIVTNNQTIFRNGSLYSIHTEFNVNGYYIYQLNIRAVSREDFGRWKCRAKTAANRTEDMNVVINVLYTPNVMYPVCGLDVSEGMLTCRSEEGNPRVVLNWYLSGEETRNIRRSEESTVNGVINSVVYLSTLEPPVINDETVGCASGNNSCQITKTEIYNGSKIVITSESIGERLQFNCKGGDNLPGAIVNFVLSNDQLGGKESSKSLNDKSISFDKDVHAESVDVACRLEWGSLSYKLEQNLGYYSGNAGTGSDGVKDNTDSANNRETADEGRDAAPKSRVWIAWVFVGLVLFCLLVLVIIVILFTRRRNRSGSRDI